MGELPRNLVELVREAIAGSGPLHLLLEKTYGYDLGQECRHADRPEVVLAAEAAVTALFDACEVREEWGNPSCAYPESRYLKARTVPDQWAPLKEMAVDRAEMRRQQDLPPETWRLIRRWVITTPAEHVPAPEEAQT